MSRRNAQDGSAEWYTPPHIVDAVRAALGGTIDLDPYSCEEGQRVVRATTYMTREQDALRTPWPPAKSIWCNPPYGAEIALCLEALVQHIETHPQAVAVALVPPNVDAAWWQDLVGNCARRILFLRGRLAFRDADGKPIPDNPKGSCLALYAGVDSFRMGDVWGRMCERLPGTAMQPMWQEFRRKRPTTNELAAYRGQERLL